MARRKMRAPLMQVLACIALIILMYSVLSSRTASQSGRAQTLHARMRKGMQCKSKCLALLSYQIHAGSADRRMLLRMFIFSQLPVDMDAAFILADSTAPTYSKAIRLENDTFQDLFLVSAPAEDYGGGEGKLPHKTWGQLVWHSQFYKQYKYFFKIDSDTILQPHLLRQRLLLLPPQLMVICRRSIDPKVFCGGPFYGASSDVIKTAAHNSSITPGYEDVEWTRWVSHVPGTRFCFVGRPEIIFFRDGRDEWKMGPASWLIHDLKDTHAWLELYNTLDNSLIVPDSSFHCVSYPGFTSLDV